MLMRIAAAALALAATPFAPTPAEAGTVSATRAWFSGRAGVAGGAANETDKVVEQSTTPGGAAFVDTGFRIDTDAAGNGSVEIPNTASGTLLKGHNVRVICAGGVICGPVIVKSTFGPFASFTPNTPQTIDFAFLDPVLADDGALLHETLSLGSILSFSLDPLEGSWFDDGISIASADPGASFSVQSLTSDTLTLSLDAVSGSGAPMGLLVSGLGFTPAPGVSLVTPHYALVGQTTLFVDGASALTHELDGQVFQTASVAAVPLPAAMLLHLAALAALAAAARSLPV